MTRSPFFVTLIVGRLTGFWSHSSGARHGLMKPAAKARKIKKMTKSGKEALVGMTAGMAGMTEFVSGRHSQCPDDRKSGPTH